MDSNNMRCAKTNIMCEGGHVILEENKVFILEENVVKEIFSADALKYINNGERVDLVVLSKEINNNGEIKPTLADFASKDNPLFYYRSTSYKISHGSKHLDLPRSKEEVAKRERMAHQIINFLQGKANDNQRMSNINRYLPLIMDHYKSIGFIRAQELITKGNSEKAFNDLPSLDKYLRLAKTMRQELGIELLYQSNELSPELKELDPAIGEILTVPIVARSSDVSDHAALRVLERVFPKVTHKHHSLVQKIVDNIEFENREAYLKELQDELRKDKIDNKLLETAKQWLAKKVTDLDPVLNPSVKKFSEKRIKNNNGNRFVLSIPAKIGNQEETLEVVCELSKKRGINQGYNVKVITVWMQEISRNSYISPKKQKGKDHLWSYEAIISEGELKSLNEKVLLESIMRI